MFKNLQPTIWLIWFSLLMLLFTSCTTSAVTPTVQEVDATHTSVQPTTQELIPTLTPTIPPSATPEPTASPTASPTVTETVEPSFGCETPPQQEMTPWRLAYASQGQLWLKEPSGEPRLLSDLDNFTTVGFTPDGEQVIFTRKNDSEAIELWMVSAADGEARQLILESNNFEALSIYTPRMSDDGEYIVFLAQDETETKFDLWVARADGSGARLLVGLDDLERLYESVEACCYAAAIEYTWIPGTHHLIFFPYWEGDTRFDPVHWIDADSGEFGIFLPETQGGAVTFSPDGNWLFVATTERLYLSSYDDLQGVAETPILTMEIPYLEYLGNWMPMPVWSPDSSSLFVMLPPEDADSKKDYTLPAPVIIWKVSVDGSEPEQLYSFFDDLGSVKFSPDFKTLVHMDGSSYVFEHATGARYVLPMPADAWGMSFLGWSPDAHHFAYSVGTGSDMGYHAIGDVCEQDSIRLHEEDFVAGLLPGFLGWLDSSHYIYFDYTFNSVTWQVQLVLGGIGDDSEKLNVDWGKSGHPVVGFWSPNP